MNPKLDAGLAERLFKVWWEGSGYSGYVPISIHAPDVKKAWLAVAAEVRKIVKEAKEGE